MFYHKVTCNRHWRVVRTRFDPGLHKTSSCPHGDLIWASIGSLWAHDEVFCRLGCYRFVVLLTQRLFDFLNFVISIWYSFWCSHNAWQILDDVGQNTITKTFEQPHAVYESCNEKKHNSISKSFHKKSTLFMFQATDSSIQKTLLASK